MREWKSFEEGLRTEARRLGVPLPPVTPTVVEVPDSVRKWLCVETADVVDVQFSHGYEPWVLVLRPTEQLREDVDTQLSECLKPLKRLIDEGAVQPKLKHPKSSDKICSADA